MRSEQVNRVAADCVVLPPEQKFDAAGLGAGTRVEADAQRKIRLLVFTSLYPDAVRPSHGIFVEERLRQLMSSGRIAATVVAPVPWFPFRHRRFGAYATFAKVPRYEERYGMRILHPRYPVIPKLGMNVAPSLVYHALLPVFRKLMISDTFDLIDAHYFYPDGVAAARLGKSLGKPVVITARGSDINVIAKHRLPGRQIKWAAERAAAIVTVSDALKDKVQALGIDPDKVVTLRNGVDLDRFQPLDRGAIRAKLDLAGSVWLSVGHLIELKGVHITLAALAKTDAATLLIVGEGPDEARLRDLASHLGVNARVRFVGTVPHAELCEYYNAADVMVLASSREGMPNVVLESLACGTPVLAAPFDGVTELLGAPEAGEVAAQRNAEGITSAWLRLQGRSLARAATREYAKQLGWQPVVDAQHALYAQVLAAANGPAPGAE